MTDFSNVCDILGELYSQYRNEPDFREFIEFNDLGLPLAYFTRDNLCEPSDDGVRYIMETWELFLKSLDVEDTGFETLTDLLEFAADK